MKRSERLFRPAGVAETPSRFGPVEPSRPGQPKRPGCGAVARNRARRYLKKRRLPKLLWPIIAAAVFIALVFDRRIGPRLPAFAGQNGLPIKMTQAAQVGHDDDAIVLPLETGAALNGAPVLRYTPPADFQAKHSAQMIAFLIRNRGKLDNDVVRRKWEHLDCISIPLAVYFRDIEANDGWTALEREIAACPASPRIGAGRSDVPSSIRQRKILKLMPEWARRGEVLLTTSGSGGSGPPGPENDCSDDSMPPVPSL